MRCASTAERRGAPGTAAAAAPHRPRGRRRRAARPEPPLGAGGGERVAAGGEGVGGSLWLYRVLGVSHALRFFDVCILVGFFWGGGGEGGTQCFAFLSRGGYHFASLHGEGEYRHRFGSLCSPPQPYPCTGGLDAVHPCLGRGPLSLCRFSRWRESRTPQLWWRFLPMHGVGVSGCLHLPSGRSPRALSMGGSRSLCIRTWSVWGGGG